MPDLRSGPPPRWRVVERDRRLVVIDTATGAEQRSTAPAAEPVAAGWQPHQVSFDGSAELTTLALYDAAGPRTIRLDPGAAQLIKVASGIALAAVVAIVVVLFVQPLLIIPLGILLAKARAPLRTRLTRWLDTVAREGT